MRYLQRLNTLPPDEADSPLILGTALHTGIEESLEAAVKKYCSSYPIITDEHINEVIKLEHVIPLARAGIPPGGAFEVPIMDEDFVGYIDYLVPINKVDGTEYFDLYDFKYSNNVQSYKKSNQLHLYKYFFERNNPGKKIKNLYLFFVPKVQIRQKKGETLLDFRERLKDELAGVDVQTVQVEFDYSKVIEFLLAIKTVNETTEFTKTESYLCRFCEYQDFCEKGWDFMILPENKRRNIEQVHKRKLWIYGAPFSGKTTFANSFPDPLMLNTDGNVENVDAPYIPIRDNVKVEGRMTKRTLAWEVFKDTISELEKKQNTFKTIVVDLLEDTYESCRVYMYQQMGITHESDDSFRAWDKVRGEYLNTMKRLMVLDYENIVLISHEDMSKDITRKGGDKITAIKPAGLPDKVANKVAGMVDVVARIVADGETRTFSFKSNEVVFGGGRLRVAAKDLPLDVDALFAVYDEANKNAANGVSENKPQTESTERAGRSRRKAGETPVTPAEKPQEEPERVEPVNDTPAEETPQESPAEGESAPAENADDGTPPMDGAVEVNAPNAQPEQPAEHPRRKRRVREA